MYEVFQICFVAGFILVVLAFLIGQFFDFTGIDGLDLQFGDLPLLAPFSPLLCFLFMTIFGGIGMLILKNAGDANKVLAVVISAAVGIGICIVIQMVVIRPLKKAENTSAANEEELIGLLAKVNEKIPKGGYGEIAYTIYGNSYVAPAKSTTGEEIKKGTEVSICWIKDHVFYVVKLKE